MVEDWLTDLTLKRRSPSTIATYRRVLRTLPEELTPRTARAWMATGKLSAASQAQRYVAAASFCKWLVAEGELDANPFERIPRPQVPVVPLRPVSEEMLRAMLNCTSGSSFAERRNRALLTVLAYEGLRVAELASLGVGVLDAETMTVVGKGDKTRTLPIATEARSALLRYGRARRRHRYASLDALWVGERGALGVNAIYKTVVTIAGQAGYGNVSPHSFRRGFATNWLERGGSESSLMALAGWTNPNMVRRYTAHQRERLAAEEFKRLLG